MSATDRTQVQPEVRREGIHMKGMDLLAWAATLLAFPIAGLAARAVAGPVDKFWSAALAGAISGAVIGAAQWLALRVSASTPGGSPRRLSVWPSDSDLGSPSSTTATRSETCGSSVRQADWGSGWRSGGCCTASPAPRPGYGSPPAPSLGRSDGPSRRRSALTRMIAGPIRDCLAPRASPCFLEFCCGALRARVCSTARPLHGSGDGIRSSHMMTEMHVVFGTGQVGLALIAELADQVTMSGLCHCTPHGPS